MFGRSSYVLQGKTRVSEFRLTWELIFPAQGHANYCCYLALGDIFAEHVIFFFFFCIGECQIADHLEFSINKVNSTSDIVKSKDSVLYG